MYIVTAIGVGIDTNVSAWDTHDSALEHMDNLLKQYDICDKQEMCTDCVKGFSKTAQCDVEIQAQYVKYNLGESCIKKGEQILVDNGIEEDEAETVLEAIGYALIDTEIYE
jgi:hypothetical protein